MISKSSYVLLLCAVLAGPMVSCDDSDEILKDALQAPATSLDAKSYNKLTFCWDKVPNAIQYGYVLTNPSGKVISENTTVGTSASFSGLLPNTEYTLNVWAFPSLESDFSSSPAFTLTATTDALKKVTAPNPVAEQNGTKVTVSWEAVPEASSYTYTLSGPGIAEPAEVETTDTSVAFFGLDFGDFEFSIFTNCTSSGYETSSAASSIVFSYEAPKDWRARGTIIYGYNYSADEIPGVLSYCFDTDTYTLEAWCGVPGYDFSFKLTADGMEVVGVDIDSYGYYQVETGLTNPTYLNVYTSGGYSTFEGDMYEGELWIGNYNPDWTVWDYNGFTWDAPTSHPSIKEICGSYLYWDWGYEVYTDWNTWTEFSYDNQPCTITKVDDTNVWISTLLSFPGFEECGVSASYDPQTMTLTMPIQPYATYYTVGLDNDDYTNGTAPDNPVVGKVAGDGSITMENWVVYYEYGGWWYKYFTYTGSAWYPDSDTKAPAKAANAMRRIRK